MKFATRVYEFITFSRRDATLIKEGERGLAYSDALWQGHHNDADMLKLAVVGAW